MHIVPVNELVQRIAWSHYIMNQNRKVQSVACRHVEVVLDFVWLFSAAPGGEVWEANMEETCGGCGRPCGGK